MVQAVILAAGKSTRTYPLTLTKPKPLLKVAGKPILAHILDQLQDIVDEVVIIVGYKKEMVEDHFGKKYKEINLVYVEQEEQKGTGHALLQAKEVLEDDFIVLMGDDYYCKEDLKKLLKHETAILVKEVEDPQHFGVLTVEDGKAVSFEEKPEQPKSNLVNTAAYHLSKKMLNCKVEKSERGEIELTCFIKEFMKKNILYVEMAETWIPITFSWSLLALQKHIIKNLKTDVKGKIEEGVVIEGNIVIGEGTVVKAGTRIEGPVVIGEYCTIGPQAYLRGPVSIGDGCHVGNSVEIKNCIIGDQTFVPHLAYVGDSILGDKVNWASGCNVANLRHDFESVKSEINEKIVDTGLKKFGTVLGDGVKLGIGTLIYPGRKIWPEKVTLPGEIVRQDKK